MKILFFDTWTKGIRNFGRLTNELDKNGFEYKLLHLESWGDSCCSVQCIMGIDCYDISYYKTSYIYDVLKKEMPDVVLILSLSYLLDRCVVSMCRHLNIKVVYLAHGKIYMKQGVGNLSSSTSVLKKFSSRLISKPSKILRNYLRFNLVTRFRPSNVFQTIREFFVHTNQTMFTPYSEEFNVDAGMVYYEEEKKMFEEGRHFPQGMIFSVGNPEMDYIINQNVLSREEFLSSIPYTDQKYALYLDDGFTQESIMSYSEWETFISQIYIPLKKKGLGLIIKLHPRTDVSPISEFLQKENILALKDVDFKNIIYHSEFVLSHSSSTVIYGMILNKAVVLPRWGAMANLIHNYPSDVVYYCETEKDYSKLLESSLLPKDTNEYLSTNCGILDGKATERIIDVITHVCENGKG